MICRGSGGKHGSVYTRGAVVEFALNLVLGKGGTLSGKTIVEPSAGDGAFAIPIINRLLKESGGDTGRLERSLSHLHLFDIDPDAIEKLRARALHCLSDSRLVEKIHIVQGDFLLSQVPHADIVIGNPPYVRYDNIPAEQREQYRRLFFSFRNRADMYVPFIEKSLRCLNENASLVFVCADRWVSNSYGAKLRMFVRNFFQFEHLVKFSNFNPFLEDVLAYPSVFLIRNRKRNNEIRLSQIGSEGELVGDGFLEKARTVHFNNNADIEYDSYSHHFKKIEAQGFHIGIGVATGADKVFITEETDRVEEELLLPLLMCRDLTDRGIDWKGRYLINTYRSDGRRVVDLDKYPKLRTFLREKADTLKRRYVARKKPDNWYKLIDPLRPGLREKPKLLIPDISTRTRIVFDKGKYYPHHNLYFITSPSEHSLLVLRSLLMSDTITQQIANKGVLMNGGALRWQAQTLRKVYIPIIQNMSSSTQARLIHSYEHEDNAAINRIVASLSK